MQQNLRKLFNIYPGEEKRLLYFSLLSFLWAFSAACAAKLSDAIFLVQLGSQNLPKAFVCISLSLFSLLAIILSLLNKISLNKIYQSLLCFSASVFVITYFTFSAELENQGLCFFLKVFSYSFLILATSCFWNFLDQYYDLQDAKRIYSILNAFVFLGFSFAGSLITKAFFRAEILYLIVALGISCSLACVLRIEKTFESLHDDSLEHVNSSISFKDLFQTILRSNYTVFLLMTCLSIQILSTLTEFHFSQDFEKAFQSAKLIAVDESASAALTKFLGKCTAWVSLGNILFGIFCYGRLVHRLGLNNILLITPLCFFLVFSGFHFPSNSLVFPIFGFVVVEGVLYAIEDNHFNLLIQAVPPNLKNHIRITIESFFEPLGMLIAAGLLSFPNVHTELIGLVLALFVISLAFLQRFEYPRAILKNLKQAALRFHKSGPEYLKSLNKKEQKQSKNLLFEKIPKMKEEEKLFAFEILLGFEDPSILEKILKEMRSLSYEGRSAALFILQESVFAEDSLVIEEIQKWSHQESTAIFSFFLAKRGYLNPQKALKNLQSDDLLLKGAAIASLKNFKIHLDSRAAQVTLASQELEKLLASSNEEELCMGLELLGLESSYANADILLSFLKELRPRVSTSAAHSLSLIANANFRHWSDWIVEAVIEQKNQQSRIFCLQSLTKIGDSSVVRPLILSSLHFRPAELREIQRLVQKIGLTAVPELVTMVKNTRLHDRCRLLAGRILGSLALPQLQNMLFELLLHEVERLEFYFFYGHKLHEFDREKDLSLIEDALKNGVQSVIDFIIEILCAAGSLQDAELLTSSLRSTNPKTHAHAVESLQKTCEHKVFELLLPFIDDRPLSVKLQFLEKKMKGRLTLQELLTKLEQSSSLLDQITAAAYKAQEGLANWRQDLRKQMDHNEELFYHFAFELLEGFEP